MARVRPKPLSEQIVVVTGASSGIGLATAELLGARGARLVLTAWDARGLADATERVRAAGGRAVSVVADVTEPGALDRVAAVAVETWGGIDTWVNNAGVHVFGRVLDTPIEDARRLFDVNVWGMARGALAALPHLKARGGVLIHVASVLSSQAVPLQGFYTASKHALKAWTDTVRIELQAEGAPVAVTTILPAAIDTPIVAHSKNLTDHRVQLPPPLYAPEVVARAIAAVARHPRRHVVVGGSGQVAVLSEQWATRLADVALKATMFRMQRRRGPRREEAALHSPPDHPARRTSDDRRLVLRHSPVTWASLHPGRAAVVLLIGAALLARARWAR